LAEAVAALAANQTEAAAMGRRGATLVAAAHSWDCRAGAVADLLSQL
jgi:hypothetical protein